jgi:hypothetical protein
MKIITEKKTYVTNDVVEFKEFGIQGTFDVTRNFETVYNVDCFIFFVDIQSFVTGPILITTNKLLSPSLVINAVFNSIDKSLKGVFYDTHAKIWSTKPLYTYKEIISIEPLHQY